MVRSADTVRPRQTNAEALDHPTRDAIRALLRRYPGASFTELQDALRDRPGIGRVGNGSLDWHLQKLRRAGLVVSVRSGGRRFYPSAGPWVTNLTDYAHAQAPRRWTVAQALVAHGPHVADGIGRTLARPMSPWQLRFTLRGFVERGLATTRRQGRFLLYEPTPHLAQIVSVLSTIPDDLRDSLSPAFGPIPSVNPRPVLPPPGAASPSILPAIGAGLAAPPESSPYV